MDAEGDYQEVVWEYAHGIAADGTVVGGRVLTGEESYRAALDGSCFGESDVVMTTFLPCAQCPLKSGGKKITINFVARVSSALVANRRRPDAL